MPGLMLTNEPASTLISSFGVRNTRVIEYDGP
jgi:hypothetical protein